MSKDDLTVGQVRLDVLPDDLSENQRLEVLRGFEAKYIKARCTQAQRDVLTKLRDQVENNIIKCTHSMDEVERHTAVWEHRRPWKEGLKYTLDLIDTELAKLKVGE